MTQNILHFLGNVLLLFHHLLFNNSFEEQLKFKKKKLKKSRHLLKQAIILLERQSKGEILNQDEKTKIGKISEFKTLILDYEKSVKKLEALVDPLEKNRLEKEKKKLMKKIRECENLKNSESELDKYAKDKIDKLPLFISNLSKIEQKIFDLKNVLEQNELEQKLLEWSFEYIKTQISDRFLALWFLRRYLKAEYIYPHPYEGWHKFKDIKNHFPDDDYNRFKQKGWIKYDIVKDTEWVDSCDLWSTLYKKYLFGLEKETLEALAVSSKKCEHEHPDNICHGHGRCFPDDYAKSYIIQQGCNFKTYRYDICAERSEMFIQSCVLKKSIFYEHFNTSEYREYLHSMNLTNQYHCHPYNFVKSDKNVPKEWDNLWKFLKIIFPHSKESVLMILLYNQDVHDQFRNSRIEDYDYDFRHYCSHRNRLYRKLLYVLFIEKTETQQAPDVLIRLINKFIGLRNNLFEGHDYFEISMDPMRKEVLFDPEYFQSTVNRFLHCIYHSVLLKKIGKFQLWNYLLGDFSTMIHMNDSDRCNIISKIYLQSDIKHKT